MAKLSKQEAIGLLGCSPRSLNNYVQQGRVAVEYVPGRTRPVATFDRDEVLRLKAALQQTTHRPAVSAPEETALARRDGAALATAQDGLRDLPNLATLLERLAHAPAAVPVADRLQLSVKDAAQLAGESADTLRAAIKARKLRARWAGNRWKIKRADLETWVKKL